MLCLKYMHHNTNLKHTNLNHTRPKGRGEEGGGERTKRGEKAGNAGGEEGKPGRKQNLENHGKGSSIYEPGANVAHAKDEGL